MPDRTGIEWTDATWNPVVGCERVSPGCAHCYAKQIHDMRHRAHQAGKAVAAQYAVPFETVQLKGERLMVPFSWRAPRRIFVNSVADLFHDDVPNDYIASVFAVMAATPRHTYQVLTKRPARMRAWFDWFWTHYYGPRRSARPWDSERLTRALEAAPEAEWPLPNVWLGVSVENQRWADERIPFLLHTPAAVRFLSCEPLLGAVNIAPYLDPTWLARTSAVGIECEHGYDVCPTCDAHGPRVDWVIAGGESGADARPMQPEWVRALRDQCTAAGVAFFFKQWGEWAEWGGENPPEKMIWLGKKKAGRSIDGRTWDEMPHPEARVA